jgi:transcriptional regulator with XRE-family HTH domain
VVKSYHSRRIMEFGEQLAQYRKDAGLTLREFSKLTGYDSSNVSKVERGLLPPPPASIVLKKWASVLGLEPDSREANSFISAGLATRFNKQVKSDKELEALMPAFFRTVGNKKLDPDTYEKLKALLRRNV